jgi:hypothetical protein
MANNKEMNLLTVYLRMQRKNIAVQKLYTLITINGNDWMLIYDIKLISYN